MIEDIFTRKNLQVLKLILEKELHLRDIAAELHCSPAKVHNAITIFKKYGLVKEKRHKNMIITQPNHQSRLLQKIIELMEMDR
ncbi:hypothetical protein HYU19_02775 [Candidatus Woesearchaeota archaeon]|nr:hypothetical protein [Candidatus Woesearchaeota archaeon]